jgi:hypothetical protein
MTRRIAQLIEEKENISKQYHTRNPDVKAIRTREDTQKTKVFISDKEEMLYMNPKKEPEQREVTISKENKSHNGKRTTEKKLTGKKARRLSKKKAKIEKL